MSAVPPRPSSRCRRPRDRGRRAPPDEAAARGGRRARPRRSGSRRCRTDSRRRRGTCSRSSWRRSSRSSSGRSRSSPPPCSRSPRPCSRAPSAPASGVLRLREPHDPAHRGGVPRGAGGREVRPRRAPRPPRRELVRPVHARAVATASSSSTASSRPRSRATPRARGVLYPLVVGLAEAGGRDARGRRPAAAGRLPDVLGHGEPEPVVGVVVHGHGREPSGRGDGPQLRREMNFGSWLLASSVPTLAAMALLPWLLYSGSCRRR